MREERKVSSREVMRVQMMKDGEGQLRTFGRESMKHFRQKWDVIRFVFVKSSD